MKILVKILKKKKIKISLIMHNKKIKKHSNLKRFKKSKLMKKTELSV